MKSSDKFYLDKYFKYREWIWDRRTDGFDWENIKYGLRSDFCRFNSVSITTIYEYVLGY